MMQYIFSRYAERVLKSLDSKLCILFLEITNPLVQVFLWMNAKHNQSNFSVTHEDINDLFLLLFCTKTDIILCYKIHFCLESRSCFIKC